MRRQVSASVAAVGMVAAALVTASPASAKSSLTAFSAANLSTWQANGVVWALAQTGSTVFAGGTFTSIRPPGAAAGTGEQPAVNFAAFDATTGAPTGCSLSFTNAAGTATVRAFSVSPDGKILYVGGSFGTVTAGTAKTGVNNFAAITIASCKPIASFHPAVPAPVRAIAATASAVYFGGDFKTVGGVAHNHLGAVTPTGAVIAAWAPSVDKPVRAIAVTGDGSRVIVGGDFDNVNGTASHALGVLDSATGATVHAFPGFFSSTSDVKDIAVTADAFYLANEGTGGGVFDGRTAVSLSDYSQIWRDTCLGATQAIVVYDNVLYSGSHAHDCSSMGEEPDGRRQHLLAQTLTSPTTKLPWYPDTNDGIGEQIGPRDMVVSSGYLWVSGEFTTVNGHPQQSLTRFGQGPQEAAPSIPLMSLSTATAGQVTVRLRSSVDNDDAALTYDIYRDGVKLTTLAGNSVWWARPQLSYTDGGLVPGSTHTYKVRASDGTITTGFSAAQTVTVPGTSSSYASAVLADNPSLFWRYDETGTTYAADSSPNNQDGQLPLTGITYNAPGATSDGNTALTFAGISQASSELRTASPSTFSVEAWFKTTTHSGGKIIGFGDGLTKDSSNYDKQVYMTNKGQLLFGVYTGTTQVIGSSKAYNNGAWHHVVATEGANGMALYVDGVRVASNRWVTTNQTFDGYWHVGGDNVNGWPNQPSSEFFAGSIDEVAVYPAALSAQQVLTHYNSK